MSADTTITLAEVERFIRRMPASHPEAGHALRDRQRRHTAGGDTLGRLTEIVFWMASWQNRMPPILDRARVVVFAATHGVDVNLAPSTDIVGATAQRVRSLEDGDAPVARLCRSMGADLRVHDLSVDHPTAPFNDGPAMDDLTCARAVVRGMMAVEEGLDLLCVGDVGMANQTSAAAMCTALFGGAASDWLGSRLDEDANDLARRTAAIAEGLAVNRPAMTDSLQVLRCLGGRDMAAIVGASWRHGSPGRRFCSTVLSVRPLRGSSGRWIVTVSIIAWPLTFPANPHTDGCWTRSRGTPSSISISVPARPWGRRSPWPWFARRWNVTPGSRPTCRRIRP